MLHLLVQLTFMERQVSFVFCYISPRTNFVFLQSAVNFYTQTKTITSSWKDEDIVGSQTVMPILGKN